MPHNDEHDAHLDFVDSIRSLMREEQAKRGLAKSLESHARAVVGGRTRGDPRPQRSFLTKLGNNFLNLIDKPDAYGVAIFFLPGTEDQVPLYYGNWRNRKPSAKEMQGRIEDNVRLLRHNMYPSFRYEVKWQDHHRSRQPLNLGHATHFFQVVRCFADVLPRIKGPSCWSDNTCGVDGLSLWARPRRRKRLAWQFPTDPFPTIIDWTPRDSYDYLVGSLINVGDNSIVLTNTFVGYDNMPDAEFLRRHEQASHMLFGALYNSVLKGKSESLRQRLGRERVSISLLDQVALKFHTEKKAAHRLRALGYEWRENEASRPGTQLLQISDLRAHLCDDIVKQPDTIFERVLDIERDIYRAHVRTPSLKRNLSQPLQRRLAFAGLRISRFPDDLPLAEILKDMETAQRALHCEQRDHVVHQLQVFLLGLLILDSDLPAVRKSFRNTIGYRLPNGAIDYLLRISWLLAALFHDVGYPGQSVDDVIKDFRRDVGTLLGLRSAKREQQVARLLIDPILEDNSTAFLLFEEVMTAVLGSEAGKQEDAEHLRHFLANRAFRDKQHAFCSMFALGLQLLEKGKFGKTRAHSWRLDPLVRILIRHTLTPIMLHHAASWYDPRRKLEPPCVPKPAMKRWLSFSNQPLACLLAFCDSLQEAERPSGSKNTRWVRPKITESFANCPKQRANLVIGLQYRFTGGTGNKTARDMIKDKIREIRQTCELFDSQEEFLSHTCLHIHGFCGRVPLKVKEATGLVGRKRCRHVGGCRLLSAWRDEWRQSIEASYR